MAAGPSLAGGWCGVVGVPDLGIEAAQAMGVDLDRTVCVPEPGERWLEVVAALVDVVDVVVLRPPAEVAAGDAARLAARLRRRGAVLVAWGDWPRCEARLSVDAHRWQGLERGHGRLAARRVRLGVARGTVPARHRDLWLPADDQQVRPVGEESAGASVTALPTARPVREVS